jgi:5'-deoxynucleotidase YfbR-like HD superfamily hydrolase
MTVAILSWYIHEKYNLNLDIAKILKYSLTHDFVERYAGDVPTFASRSERDNKVRREQESLNRLGEEFKDFEDMITTMREYEIKDDEESLFVWSVDKIQQLVMGDLDEWRSYAEAPITYDQFVSKYTELLGKSSKYSREIFESILEYSKTTYYERS